MEIATKKNALSVASFVLGMISVCSFILFFAFASNSYASSKVLVLLFSFQLALSTVGLILGIVSAKKVTLKGLAITGICLSAVTLVLNISFFTIGIYLMSNK
ncbi:hypothetical protein MF625_07950 [Paenibacillus polymyxa]|uniref:hypothetical protein n=1 Tax=Paenibacillus polymyxa TaxID=1406 RepID=UPI002024215E|nr:hypothetical protein [Paenibacillus polymyxa]WDZ57711.1 hypothetical protein MF625_07950 [Paenibacillus polymyxa]